MKPVFDFLEQAERDEKFYFKLYYLLMEECNKSLFDYH